MSRDDSAGNSRRATILVGVAALAAAIAVLSLYHNRFWYAPDDGAYAYVAERILEGDVLNRDVQDVHFGYINFANAAALATFGRKLVSLRYPLILIGAISAWSAYWLLARRNLVAAVCGALVVASLSIVQFLNPTAHWYSFGLFWLLVVTLAKVPRAARWRTVSIGFLVGLMFCFRQLSGVIASIGVVTWLLLEDSASEEPQRRTVARVIGGVMFAGLAVYLASKVTTATFLVYGIWPLALITAAAWKTQMSDRAALKMVGQLTLGALVAASPLVAYHTYHGSIAFWLNDTIICAFSLTELDFFNRISFPLLARACWDNLQSADDLTTAANSLFWIVGFVTAPVLGLLAMMKLRDSLSPLVVLAVCFSVASLHYQIPIYLFYTLAISLVAILEIVARSRPALAITVAGCLMLCVTGLSYQAAQPTSRGLPGLLHGEHVALVASPDIPRGGLWVPETERQVYADAVALIERETSPDETILALPVNPELYFLSGRRSAVRFFNSGLVPPGDEQRQTVRDALRDEPPRLVFFDPDDKYNTRLSAELMEDVRREFRRLPDLGPFEVYLRPDTNTALAGR